MKKSTRANGSLWILKDVKVHCTIYVSTHKYVECLDLNLSHETSGNLDVVGKKLLNICFQQEKVMGLMSFSSCDLKKMLKMQTSVKYYIIGNEFKRIITRS